MENTYTIEYYLWKLKKWKQGDDVKPLKKNVDIIKSWQQASEQKDESQKEKGGNVFKTALKKIIFDL